MIFCIDDTQDQFSLRLVQPLDKLAVRILNLLAGFGRSQRRIKSVIEIFSVSFMCPTSCQQDTIAQSVGNSYIFFAPNAFELILSITARMPSHMDRSVNTSTTLPWSVNGGS